MAFVDDRNIEEKIIRPENQVTETPKETPKDTPKPEEGKQAVPTETPKETPKETPAEGDIASLLKEEIKLEEDPKPKEGETPSNELSIYLEEKGGREKVDQAVQLFDNLISREFDGAAFIEEMEEELPENLNSICRAIVQRYPKWIAQEILGITPEEVKDLRRVKAEMATRLDKDDDALIKEYEESDDEEKQRYAKALRENKMLRQSERESRQRAAEAQAQADAEWVALETNKLIHTSFSPAEKIFQAANIPPIQPIKPGETLTVERVFNAMVRGGFVMLFDNDELAGPKMDDAKESIKEKKLKPANLAKPLLAEKAARYAKMVVEVRNKLLRDQKTLQEKQAEPALKRTEPPAAGTKAPSVPAGNQVPQKPMKIGSKEEDAFISSMVGQLRAEGKIADPNRRAG